MILGGMCFPTPANARFPHGPSERDFAPNWWGSILVTPGPARRAEADGYSWSSGSPAPILNRLGRYVKLSVKQGFPTV